MRGLSVVIGDALRSGDVDGLGRVQLDAADAASRWRSALAQLDLRRIGEVAQYRTRVDALEVRVRGRASTQR